MKPKVVYESERCQLWRGDCRDILPTLELASVDAVVTDPPYGQTSEAYDSPIAFCPDVWRECFRVAKPNTALLSFAGSPTYHRIASAIDAGGWKVRQMWAWVYRDGLITSAWPKEGFDRLTPAMDPIVFATKGKVLLRMHRHGASWRRSAKGASYEGFSERSSGQSLLSAGGSYPRTIVSDGAEPFEYFALARTNGGSLKKSGHPNQKPLALMNWLLDKLPDGLCLDPFAGSGTTGVACLQTGRPFIGIERDPAYCKIAAKRLKEAEKESRQLMAA